MANINIVHTTVKQDAPAAGVQGANQGLFAADWNAVHFIVSAGAGIQIVTDGGNPPTLTFIVGGGQTSVGGNLVPSLDNTFDVGQIIPTSLRWRNGYYAGTISVGTNGANGYISTHADGVQGGVTADIALNSAKAAGQSIGLNVGGDIDIAANLGRVALISGSLDVFVDGTQQAMYPTGPDTVGLGIGSNSAAHWNGIRLTGATGISGYAASSTNLLFVLNSGSGLGLYQAAGDANFAVNLFASGVNGALQFGPGGASAPDISVERNAGNLRFLANSNRIMWDGTAFSPVTDNARDLGIAVTQRWRSIYFSTTLSGGSIVVSGLTNNGQITGSLIPSGDGNFDIGSTTLHWRNVFVSGTVSVGGGSTNTIIGTPGTNALTVQGASATVSAGGGFQSNATGLITWGNGSQLSIAGGAAAGSLQVNTTFLPATDNANDLGFSTNRFRHIFFGGSLNNGLSLTSVGTTLVPNTDNSFDLGATSLRWRDLRISSTIRYSGTATINESVTGTVNLQSIASAGGGFQTNNATSLDMGAQVQLVNLGPGELHLSFLPSKQLGIRTGVGGTDIAIFTDGTIRERLVSNSGTVLFNVDSSGVTSAGGGFQTNANPVLVWGNGSLITATASEVDYQGPTTGTNVRITTGVNNIFIQNGGNPILVAPGTTFSPTTDNTTDLGNNPNQQGGQLRWRNGYFAGTVSVGTVNSITAASLILQNINQDVQFGPAAGGQSFKPQTDNLHNLGTSGLRWGTVFGLTFSAVGGTLSLTAGNNSLSWNGTAIQPGLDNSFDFGGGTVNRFRSGYFASSVSAATHVFASTIALGGLQGVTAPTGSSGIQVFTAGVASSGNFWQLPQVPSLSSAGWGASQKGAMWFNTTINKVQVWDGTNVQNLTMTLA